MENVKMRKTCEVLGQERKRREKERVRGMVMKGNCDVRKYKEKEGHEEDLNEGRGRVARGMWGGGLVTPVLGISDTCFYRIKVLWASPEVQL